MSLSSPNANNSSLSFPTQQSTTKKTLIELLQKETQALRIDIIQKSQQALIKQLAKGKVIYKLSRRNTLQLVYAFIALSEYYVEKLFFEPALKNLIQSLAILQTGDALFLIGQIYFHQNMLQEAKQYLEYSLQTDWIEPSNDHKIASRLECMTLLQKIYFSYGVSMKQKLLELSEQKIKETQKQNSSTLRKRDNCFMALSMADLATIYQAFEQYETALQKITQAVCNFPLMIEILETSNQNHQKLQDFYLKKQELHKKINTEKLNQPNINSKNMNYKEKQNHYYQRQMINNFRI